LRVSSLLVLSGFFLVSFMARAAVLASEVSSAGKLGSPAVATNAGKRMSRADCVAPELAASVIEADERARLRDEKLAEREQTLKIVEGRIERRLKELEDSRKVFVDAAEKASGKRTADLQKVAAVYAGMKPAQAGAIIDGMDPQFAAGLLAAMSSETAAAIVAAMDPEKAYAVTVLMANHYNSLTE
jgi:flagellar motility protein MotE (MotC chaperone)